MGGGIWGKKKKQSQLVKVGFGIFFFLKIIKGIFFVVIRFEDNGEMLKCKTEWYFSRTHKEKQEFSINSERLVWKLILDQKIDDVLSFMNDARFMERINEFSEILYRSIEKLVTRLEEALRDVEIGIEKEVTTSGERKKELVKRVKAQEGLGEMEKSLLIRSLTGDKKEEPVDVVTNFIKRNLTTSQKLEGVRVLLGGIRFSE
eukprot:TRINITY_DN5621_c0_g1_i3.p2 TRINITY_DN5621_c0_g1~~TRINITY_DN5621_c0_g1_i3.p2  ORF type:complete len:203 (+),score=48.40 TRINITY_DN5621_c0_g1_i3:138-746(+)